MNDSSVGFIVPLVSTIIEISSSILDLIIVLVLSYIYDYHLVNQLVLFYYYYNFRKLTLILIFQ